MRHWKKVLWIALAIPTFYMPLAYLALVVHAVGMMLSPWSMDLSPVEQQLGTSAIVVMVCMWCIYVPWAVLSRALTWKEKLWWVAAIFLLNMLAMPAFHIWIWWRYTGRDRRHSERAVAAAERHLNSLGLSREALTDTQWQVFFHWMKVRSANRWWLMLFQFLLAILLAGVAFWGYHIVSTLPLLDAVLTRTVFVDASGQVTRTLEPDTGTIEKARHLMLLLGFSLGLMAATAIHLLVDRAIDYWAFRRQAKRQDDFLREMRPPGTPAGESE